MICLGCTPVGGRTLDEEADTQPATGDPVSAPTADMIPAPAAGGRLITLRRAGTCEGCGASIDAGQRAWWRRGQPLVICLVCRPEGGADPAAPSPDEPSRPEAAAGPASAAMPEDIGPQAIDARATIDSGVAGGSATREYRRRHDRREAGIRGRWGRLSALVLALTSDPSTTRAWERGSVGESKLAATLGKVDRDDVVFLHDRRVPRTRGNIDHIVVAPSGVYVVDTKRYAGEVRVRDLAGLFSGPDRRLFVGRRDCSHLANQMRWQVDAVRAVLGSRQDVSIIPVLCFVDAEWPLFGAPDEFEGVRTEGPRSLRKLVTREGTLTADDVVEVAVVLAEALPAYAPTPVPDLPA